MSDLRSFLKDELNELTGGEAAPEEEEPAPAEDEKQPEEATIKLLEDRIATYKLAIAKATAENESGKARRYTRGLKTLEGLVADAKHGRPVDTNDVPPLLPPSATGTAAPTGKFDNSEGEFLTTELFFFLDFSS